MDKNLNRILLIFFLSFGLFTSYVLLSKPLTKLTRASEETKISAQNSLIFAWPLKLQTNNSTRITVFARNYNGRAIEGKSVTLRTTFGQINQSTITTDNEGKSVFIITSSTPGVAEIEAIVDNIRIQRTISVQFE